MKLKMISFFLITFLVVSYSYAETRIAVRNFQTKNCDKDFGEISSQEFLKVLGENKELTVIDRKSMENTFKQKHFRSARCISARCAVKIGKMLEVDFIIEGKVSKISDIFYIAINCIDVKTGKIKYSKSIYAKKETDVLTLLSHNIAVEFSNEYLGTDFPLLKLNSNGAGSNGNNSLVDPQHSVALVEINKASYFYFKGNKLKMKLKWKEVKSLLMKNPASKPYMEKEEKLTKNDFIPALVIICISELFFIGGYFVLILNYIGPYMSDSASNTLAGIWPYSGLLFGLGFIIGISVLQPTLDRLKKEAVNAYNSSPSDNNMKLKGLLTLSKNGPRAGLTLVF